MVARSCPRDEVAAIDRIKNACQRPGLAEKAEYVYNRGGTDITGATIDLLQVIATCWGNIDFGFRELSQSNGESTVECYAWDLETNAKEVRVVTIPHARYAHKRLNPLIDPRDIYELIANNAQRRVRACLEAVIPPDIVDDAVAECQATLKASAVVDAASIAKLLEFFARYTVTRDQIQKRIGRRLEAMQPAQLVRLRAIGKSLQDGMSESGDWFEMAPSADEALAPKTATEAAKQALRARKTQTAEPETKEPIGETTEAVGETEPPVTETPVAPKETTKRKSSPASTPKNTEESARVDENATAASESSPAQSTSTKAAEPPTAAPEAPKPRKGGLSAKGLEGFIRNGYEDECGAFDIPALAQAAHESPNPTDFITRVMDQTLDGWERFKLNAKTPPKPDPESQEQPEQSIDQSAPDFVTDPPARPKKMRLAAENIERAVVGMKTPDSLRRYVGDIVHSGNLMDAEIDFLVGLAQRRAWQLEHGIEPTDKVRD